VGRWFDLRKVLADRGRFYLVKENDKLFAVVVSPYRQRDVSRVTMACVFNADILVEINPK